jgi:hypothetical protein
MSALARASLRTNPWDQRDFPYILEALRFETRRV